MNRLKMIEKILKERINRTREENSRPTSVPTMRAKELKPFNFDDNFVISNNKMEDFTPENMLRLVRLSMPTLVANKLVSVKPMPMEQTSDVIYWFQPTYSESIKIDIEITNEKNSRPKFEID